jgi:hypothetical protein
MSQNKHAKHYNVIITVILRMSACHAIMTQLLEAVPNMGLGIIFLPSFSTDPDATKHKQIFV